jgi:hypothetical protein
MGVVPVAERNVFVGGGCALAIGIAVGGSGDSTDCIALIFGVEIVRLSSEYAGSA